LIMQAMEISRTGLDVEWRRLEIIAQNLANASSAGYQPRRLVSGPAGSFKDHVGGVEVKDVALTGASPNLVHEPNNPQADSRGFVSYPGIDQAAEMTMMVKASRVYEANIVAMNSARQMYSKALELGRR